MKTGLITDVTQFRGHFDVHVRKNQEFNLFTNGINELRSYITNVAQCCGECSFIEDHLTGEIYEIPWYQFHLEVHEKGIILLRREDIRPIRPLEYRGYLVNKIKIQQPV